LHRGRSRTVHWIKESRLKFRSATTARPTVQSRVCDPPVPYARSIREGLEIAANPVLGTNRPAQAGSRERVLTETELSAIWHACGDVDYERIVRLLQLTAQRRDEVGSKQWAELDAFSGLWTLPSADQEPTRAFVTICSRRPGPTPTLPKWPRLPL
jgi:integrase